MNGKILWCEKLRNGGNSGFARNGGFEIVTLQVVTSMLRVVTSMFELIRLLLQVVTSMFELIRLML